MTECHGNLLPSRSSRSFNCCAFILLLQLHTDTDRACNFGAVRCIFCGGSCGILVYLSLLEANWCYSYVSFRNIFIRCVSHSNNRTFRLSWVIIEERNSNGERSDQRKGNVHVWLILLSVLTNRIIVPSKWYRRRRYISNQRSENSRRAAWRTGLVQLDQVPYASQRLRLLQTYQKMLLQGGVRNPPRVWLWAIAGCVILSLIAFTSSLFTHIQGIQIFSSVRCGCIGATHSRSWFFSWKCLMDGGFSDHSICRSEYKRGICGYQAFQCPSVARQNCQLDWSAILHIGPILFLPYSILASRM